MRGRRSEEEEGGGGARRRRGEEEGGGGDQTEGGKGEIRGEVIWGPEVYAGAKRSQPAA